MTRQQLLIEVDCADDECRDCPWKLTDQHEFYCKLFGSTLLDCVLHTPRALRCNECLEAELHPVALPMGTEDLEFPSGDVVRIHKQEDAPIPTAEDLTAPADTLAQAWAKDGGEEPGMSVEVPTPKEPMADLVDRGVCRGKYTIPETGEVKERECGIYGLELHKKGWSHD
jgi:hypothetical protein